MPARDSQLAAASDRLVQVLKKGSGLFEPHVCIACGKPAGDSLIHSFHLHRFGRFAGGQPCNPADASLNHLREHMCRLCLADLPFHFPLEPLILPRTGLPVYPVFRYADPIDRLLIALKFSGRKAYARWFGAALDLRLRQLGFERARCLLIPVPLGAKRRRGRGYNQAELIARELAFFSCGRLIPAADLLVRIKETARQSELKSHAARLENAQDAFALNRQSGSLRRAGQSGTRLILLDDVLTTGATLESAARPLLDLGGCLTALACAGERSVRNPGNSFAANSGSA